MKRLKYLLVFALFLFPVLSRATSLLIPMDDEQKDHLKSYGIAYWVLKNGEEVNWLLNYRGGSFMMQYSQNIESECKIRGVSYEVIPDAKANEIITEVSDPYNTLSLSYRVRNPKCQCNGKN